MEIVIYKSRRRLEVREGEKIIADFNIAIGKSEIGHKEREGDMRTPEGEYRVIVKNPNSKFHLSLGLDYPNLKDAEIGLKGGLIDKSEYEEIALAQREGKIPPWKTALGGEIFIHGELEKQAWSAGCVRMFNEDMEQLYALVGVGTPVKILP